MSNSDHQMEPMTCQAERSIPHLTSSAWLIVPPKPMSTKKRPIRVTRATGFHFTQAEIARARRERKTIQTQLPTRIATATDRFCQSHPFSRDAWKVKRRIPGTQVMAESRISRTDILPSTYSVRVNG